MRFGSQQWLPLKKAQLSALGSCFYKFHLPAPATSKKNWLPAPGSRFKGFLAAMAPSTLVKQLQLWLPINFKRDKPLAPGLLSLRLLSHLIAKHLTWLVDPFPHWSVYLHFQQPGTLECTFQHLYPDIKDDLCPA